MNLDLKLATPAAVQVVPHLGMDGRMVAVVIVKEAFVVDEHMTPVRTHDAVVHVVDELWEPDAPEISTIRAPSDVVLGKPGTDVVVAGDAMAPGEAPSKSLDVFVRVGPVQESLRVHGARVWYHGAMGLALSAPVPFQRLPLRWELAWGGADLSDPKRPFEEPRNPAGRGHVRDERELIGKPGPQIEDPAQPLPARRPVPVGVGPLGRHWEPRRRWAGTYDEAWKKTRMPLPPLDFDPRYNQVAPPALVAPTHLRGGEPVQLGNLNADGPLQFPLPRLNFFVGLRTDDGWQEGRPVLDTVLLEPNARRLSLTYRATLPMPGRKSVLRYVQVHEKELL